MHWSTVDFRYAYSKQDSKCLPSDDNTQWIRTGSNNELKGKIKITCSRDFRASDSECDFDPEFDIYDLDYDEYEDLKERYPEYCVFRCQELFAAGDDPEFTSAAVRNLRIMSQWLWFKVFLS